jgi:aspartate/methionine/tyrosine aminotransferase
MVMDLEDAGTKAKFLIRDCDAKFPALCDQILADAGIQTVPGRVFGRRRVRGGLLRCLAVFGKGC